MNFTDTVDLNLLQYSKSINKLLVNCKYFVIDSYMNLLEEIHTLINYKIKSRKN